MGWSSWKNLVGSLMVPFCPEIEKIKTGFLVSSFEAG